MDQRIFIEVLGPYNSLVERPFWRSVIEASFLHFSCRFEFGCRAEVEGVERLEFYRGTSLIRNSAPLGPYSRTMPRALWWS